MTNVRWTVAGEIGGDVVALVAADVPTGEFAVVLVPPGTDPKVIAEVKGRRRRMQG